MTENVKRYIWCAWCQREAGVAIQQGTPFAHTRCDRHQGSGRLLLAVGVTLGICFLVGLLVGSLCP